MSSVAKLRLASWISRKSATQCRFLSTGTILKRVRERAFESQPNTTEQTALSLLPRIKFSPREMLIIIKKRRAMLTSSEIKEISKLFATEYHRLHDEILTVAGVAEMLNKSQSAIRQMCYRKQLPYHKKYSTIYFSKREITTFLLASSQDCE